MKRMLNESCLERRQNDKILFPSVFYIKCKNIQYILQFVLLNYFIIYLKYFFDKALYKKCEKIIKCITFRFIECHLLLNLFI